MTELDAVHRFLEWRQERFLETGLEPTIEQYEEHLEIQELRRRAGAVDGEA